MKLPLRPTLVRRVVLSLLLAVVLAWLAVMAYSYVVLRIGLKTNPGLLQVGSALNEALETVEREDLATAIVEASSRHYNRLRARGSEIPGALPFQLRNRHGSELYSTESIRGQRLPGQVGKVIDATVNGQPYWVYEGQSTRWTLWMAEPSLNTVQLLSLLGGELTVPFLIAIPFVFIPVWWVVSRGLRPLRALGEHIRRRKVEDLSALGFEPKYDELVPLVAALESLLAQLRRRVEREHTFVQDAAHELRTPLAVIRTQAHIMARTTDCEQVRDAVAHLEHAVDRGSHLVAQLLDLATLDAGDSAVRRRINVADLTRRHMAQAMTAAPPGSVELELDSPDELNAEIRVELFETILRNLLDNAIKYGGQSVRVAVTLQLQGTTLRLAVADNGPGIAPRERALVFERFYRGQGSNTTGAGLGLAIVLQACQRMSGAITLKDNPCGQGCLFEVAIPLRGDAWVCGEDRVGGDANERG